MLGKTSKFDVLRAVVNFHLHTVYYVHCVKHSDQQTFVEGISKHSLIFITLFITHMPLLSHL